jgi:hypothetical protein
MLTPPWHLILPLVYQGPCKPIFFSGIFHWSNMDTLFLSAEFSVTWFDTLTLTAFSWSWHTELFGLSRKFFYKTGPWSWPRIIPFAWYGDRVQGVIRQRRMLTPPWHLNHSDLCICRRSVLPCTRFCNCLFDCEYVLHIANFALFCTLYVYGQK